MDITSIKSENNYRTWRLPVVVIALLLINLNVWGQTTVTEKPPLKERIFYGGSIALRLGTATDIEILPVVGLWLLPRIAVAAGPGYRFYSYQGSQTSIYSFRSYAQFVPIRDIDRLIPVGVHTSILLQFEYEALSLDSQYWHNVDLEPNRFWENTMMLGPGISQQLGQRSSMNILVLWSLTNSPYEIYGNPVIRIGFVF